MDILASWVHVVIPIVFLLVCVLLILVILLQKGRGGGLAGAFGGAGGYSAFGAKTGDFFTWLTVGLAGLFVIVACLGVWYYLPDQEKPVPPVQGTNMPGGESTGGGSTTQPS
ncbi:MAG TPA: preprotein translocase subunit SecG [Phycisphaerae bacterium]|nr:preprotein translocase subunit SecG [Phycisphaerae bacterium]HRR84071.1 preprotein translocase subunit SecG [Phycisphaerae bacterium]